MRSECQKNRFLSAEAPISVSRARSLPRKDSITSLKACQARCHAGRLPPPRGAEGFLKAPVPIFFYPDRMTDHSSEQQGDAEAQQHPEGNVPDRIESPEVGLPVADGQPSGEQNAEETEPVEREED